ncbi:MAG: thioredoxin domain-containing protein [Solirubrobacterales bacterium]|nr:thioredoxin domain-containing protein [Solirubrobacterales bacterium]HMT06169.1 thioredoxin domain-containing protein [Solirubrobacterales bacterium]
MAEEAKRRPGQLRTLIILAVAAGALLIGLVGIATREPGQEYDDVVGVGDMQRIFGGVRQLDDRLGSDDAPVQMQLFLDAQSSTYRDQFLDTVPALVTGPVRDGTLKLLYRNRSLTRNATELSFYGIEAAARQGYAWQYAYLMFRNHEAAEESGLDEEFLTRLAESIENLEIEEWKQDFEEGLEDGSQMNADLQAQDQIAIDLEIRDQPAAVVNGPGGTEVVQDAPDLTELETAIGEVQ